MTLTNYRSRIAPVLFLVGIGVVCLLYSGKRQTSASVNLPQCAHWAVVRAAERLGQPVSASEVYRLLPPHDAGHSVQQVADALNALGLSAEIKKASFTELVASPSPMILHLASPDHFVVLLGIDSPGQLIITDPIGSLRVVAMGPLEERATGYGILVTRVKQRTGEDITLDGPVLQFDCLFLDTGGILPSQKESRFEFPFTNTGEKPLAIKNVHTKCSCIHTEYPRTPIQPGGKEKIVVVYHVDPEKPSFHEEAAVESNDPRHPLLLLKASGRLNLEVRVSPSAVNFGLCRAGEVHKKLVFVRFRSRALPVTAVVEGESHISAIVLNGATDFDSRGIWEGAGERPESEKDWPLVCVELTLSSEASESFSFWGEPRLVLSTPIKEFQNVEIPMAGRVVKAQ